MTKKKHATTPSVSRRGSEDVHEVDLFLMSKDDQLNNALVSDITIDWVYNPHTLTALSLIVLGLIGSAFTTPETNTPTDNLIRGVYAACGVFLLLGLLVFPSGPFTRPHPAVWRLALGASLIYLIALIILLFQDLDTARSVWKYILHEDLGVQPAAQSYSVDCSFTWESLKPKIFDRFLVSHFLGWVGQSLMIRDRGICWAVSIVWELVELGLVYALPNFSECWWDQMFLDVFGCNMLGIEVGIRLCEYFEVKNYQWSGIFTIPTIKGKVERAFMQFTPASWTKVRWHKFKSLKRFLAVNFVMLVLILGELNSFLLKHILWLPDSQPINIYRLLLWLFMGCSGLRQLYVYIVDPNCKRLGAHAATVSLVLIVEVLIAAKHWGAVFPPMPYKNKVLWGVGVAVWVLFCMFLSLRRHKKTKSS